MLHSFQVHDDKFLLLVHRLFVRTNVLYSSSLFSRTRRRPDISMRGLFSFWFESLFDGVGVIDIWSAFGRSLRLGLRLVVLTVILASW